jgi:hypothetical protein
MIHAVVNENIFEPRMTRIYTDGVLRSVPPLIPFVRGEDGVLRLPHRGARVTTEFVRQLMDEEGI